MHTQNRYRPNIQGALILGLLIFGGCQVYSLFDSKNWPEVTGKVTGIELLESNYMSGGRYSYRRNHVYTPVVKYLYLVDHVSYEGSSQLTSFGSRSDALDHAYSYYPKGCHLRVLYHPNHPNFSSLHRSQI